MFGPGTRLPSRVQSLHLLEKTSLTTRSDGAALAFSPNSVDTLGVLTVLEKQLAGA